MKINKNFILREIAGDYVIVPIGETAMEFNGMINVNETGAFLWKCLQEETSLDAMTEAMLKEYEVEKDEAKKDIEEFVSLLKEKKILD